MCYDNAFLQNENAIFSFQMFNSSGKLGLFQAFRLFQNNIMLMSTRGVWMTAFSRSPITVDSLRLSVTCYMQDAGAGALHY